MDELDELVALTQADDATALRDILARNPTLRTALDSRQTVYKAFVDGDEAAITAAAASRATSTTQQQATTTQAAAASFDISQLDAELDKRFTSRFTQFAASPEFATAVETRAEARAKAILEAERSNILGAAASTSDQIYTIRRSHEHEFGKELDTTAFSAYLTANDGKFVNLAAAHDAFVQEERITARIDKGVKEKLASQQTSEVPGSSLPTAQSPLGAMMRANPMNKDMAARGDGLDAAAKAFRALQTSAVN